MASATPIIPSSGNFPVALSPGLFQSTNKKRKRSEQDLLALRCKSVHSVSAGILTLRCFQASFNDFDHRGFYHSFGERVEDPPGRHYCMSPLPTSIRQFIEIQSHGAQIFDVREEQSKMRECVLVYDEATHVSLVIRKADF